MKLKCENIGKLSSAEVEINTITLIAGLNSTGKSTVGKLLYCIFNSFYNFEKEAQITLKNFIRNQFFEVTVPFPAIDDCVEELYKLRFSDDEDLIKQTILDYTNENFFTKKNITIINRIKELLNLSDDEIYKWILQAKFYSEFGNNIQNIFSKKKNSIVDLIIKDNDISVLIKNNKIYGLQNFQNLLTEVIYIDDPFVLDNLSQRNRFFGYGRDHKFHLQRKLLQNLYQSADMDSAVSELLATRKIENIYKKIDSVCNGNVISEGKSGISFQFDGSKKTLGFENLSTGLKSFSIIKTLLLNGSLVENGTIVLDEPEIHLHPEWQKLLAEIIVLIQKDFNMHILINSHSPYFINAIDVYSQKYGIKKTCKYYLAKDIDEYNSELLDVTSNLEPIYKLLFAPMQDLEDEQSEIEQ